MGVTKSRTQLTNWMDIETGHKLNAEELMLLNCGAGEDSLRVPCTARRSNRSVLKEVNPDSIGRTDAEAEALILWPPDGKS